MAEAEGVIKFNLRYRQAIVSPGPELGDLLAWRDRFYRLGIIGRDPQRYGGDAFGNISRRIDSNSSFLISGSQTGGYAHALPEHFTYVDEFDLDENSVVAHGPVRPSSESLTHGAIYALSPAIRCVVHGHSPQLWNRAARIGLPSTARDIAYGTPAMARAIATLYEQNGKPAKALFCMLGHEDGIIAFGEDFPAIEALIKRGFALATGS